MWGLVAGAAATFLEMGRRTGEWLSKLAEDSRTRVEVGLDYSTDYELMEHALREPGLWDRVREVLSPVNVGALNETLEGELAAEECFREMHRRGLARHHALTDANALRAAYLAAERRPFRSATAETRTAAFGRSSRPLNAATHRR